MEDLYLDWCGDLAIGPTGDLLLANGTSLSNQRIVRRLLTNPGDYVWNGTYGAGLARSVGDPLKVVNIEAVIRRQLELDDLVALFPTPTVEVTNVDCASGTFVAEIEYALAGNGQGAHVVVSSR